MARPIIGAPRNVIRDFPRNEAAARYAKRAAAMDERVKLIAGSLMRLRCARTAAQNSVAAFDQAKIESGKR